jgi:alpha-amylase/alpha-mannosidase (GH57 family)
MTTVAILWHMHQPFYEDLVTHEHILPWVRLHALKDYFGMVALLREFPGIRVTFNLVPSLLVQVEAFAEGQAKDHHLALGLKPAADLTAADAAFIVEHFFHAHREHMIGRFPRYAELLALRGIAEASPGGRDAAARRFGVDDLRDLQVLHKLAWVDPLYLDGDERVQRLAAKGRGFDEDDKTILRAVELEILNKVIPEYRLAADRGQVELSTSPFYHPILPLLCDSDVYFTTHPDSTLQRGLFRRPEDAAEQLQRAVACFERLFGQRPTGLWPSEGSVSDALIPLVAAAGFRWMATDELVLARTLGAAFTRDPDGQLQQPESLYAPWRIKVRGGSIACVFRDHLLSDLIGFTYAGWAAEAAADDFCARLRKAGQRHRDATGGQEALIPIILDGENAWEHFPGGGRPFLRALYDRLSRDSDLRTVTMSEACAEARRELPGIFPGSWIDANFYIWIGHRDDHAAWRQLSDARDVIDAASDADPAIAAQAREEALIAEGSDWFWWYGDDHSSDHDAEFDGLFRRHLRNVYQLLGRPIPDDLFATNISTGGGPALHREPTAFLAPIVDGEPTSYFEWLSAGVWSAHEEAAGAMHQTEADAQVEQVHFGFDAQRLFVRVDAGRAMVDLLAEGAEVVLKFFEPRGARFVVRQVAGRLLAGFGAAEAPEGRGALDPRGARAAAGSVLEVGLPFAALGAAAGSALSFVVLVCDEQGAERERHPGNLTLDLVVPDAAFESRQWCA